MRVRWFVGRSECATPLKYQARTCQRGRFSGHVQGNRANRQRRRELGNIEALECMKALRQGLAAGAANRTDCKVGAYRAQIGEEIAAIDAGLAKLRGASGRPARRRAIRLEICARSERADHHHNHSMGDFQDGRLQNKIAGSFARAVRGPSRNVRTPVGQEILHALIDRMESAAGIPAAPGRL